MKLNNYYIIVAIIKILKEKRMHPGPQWLVCERNLKPEYYFRMTTGFSQAMLMLPTRPFRLTGKWLSGPYLSGS